MAKKPINAILSRSWLRIGLAVALLVVGLAPIGVPIVSDNRWWASQPGPETANLEATQPFMYRAEESSDGTSRVERSSDEGVTWQYVAAIPFPVSELVAVAGNEQVVYARGQGALWVSEDAGATWSQTASLPSRPVSLAVTGEQAGTVYVGTESMGLLRSRNHGQSWQSLDSPTFWAGEAVPLGITALSINPEDEQIVYAAAGFWLGTSQARFNPLGLFASVDGGTHWFQVARAALGSAPVKQIEPVPGKPLTVVAVDATGSHRFSMGLSETLLESLDAPDAGTRAATARAIGLVGDRAAIRVLLEALRRDTDILAGEQIAGALGRLGDRSVIPPLLETLGTGDEATQARSAYALGLLGAQEAVPLLARTLETGMPMAQRRAAEALAAVGTPEAIAVLKTPLANAQMTSARNAAMIGLEVAGDRAVGSLAQSLGDRNPILRTNAAEMLGWLKANQATPELSRALADADSAVRVQAAWALGEIGTAEARQALAEALPAEANPEVRQASQAALARADAPGRGVSIVGPGWAAGLLGVLATIPLGKWAFMILATAVAVFLLMAGSRPAQTRTV
jgi:HEAT repeat protein